MFFFLLVKFLGLVAFSIKLLDIIISLVSISFFCQILSLNRFSSQFQNFNCIFRSNSRFNCCFSVKFLDSIRVVSLCSINITTPRLAVIFKIINTLVKSKLYHDFAMPLPRIECKFQLHKNHSKLSKFDIEIRK